MKARAWILVLLLSAGSAPAHEGDSEERAMRLLGLLNQLDRTWVALQAESEPAKRAQQLEKHAQYMGAVQEALRDATDQSPCILMESRDSGRQLACLVDTEARLRATERLLGHVLNRVTLAGK